MIDESKLKSLYEKLINGDTQPIRDWVNKNPQEAVDLVQKYLNITKTELNKESKAGLKGRVKTKKPKKTRKKKTKKMKLKVKIGGGEPLIHPLLQFPVAIIGVVLFFLLQRVDIELWQNGRILDGD